MSIGMGIFPGGGRIRVAPGGYTPGYRTITPDQVQCRVPTKFIKCLTIPNPSNTLESTKSSGLRMAFRSLLSCHK
jgi:hypothetical protein